MDTKSNLNQIILGDAYELIKNVPDKSIDLIITDPPYEIVGGGNGGCFGVEHRDYHHEYKILSRDDHKSQDIQNTNIQGLNCVCAGFDYSLLNELDRVMKRINIYIWCNKNQISSLMKHYEDAGCNVDLLVWHKTNPIPTCNNKYLSDLEYCVYAREPGVGLGGTYETKSKLFETPCNKEDKEDYGHPTIKPLPIIETLLKNSSKPGDVVLDPFSGSGTTCFAAKINDRQYLGFEIDPKFYEVSKKRLEGVVSMKKDESGITYEQLSLL